MKARPMIGAHKIGIIIISVPGTRNFITVEAYPFLS